ncbi:MAG: exosortase/archaeosortase family protein [Williamsia sp.]|nr:exosortase/archaeosortase family protein [Williamsia sp.]
MHTKAAQTYISKLAGSSLSKYVDVVFFLKFIVLMGGIYYFNVFYISIIDARGYIYSSFFDQHLNYFSLLRASILHTANFLDHLYGLDSYVADPYRLKLQNGHGVFVDLACLGYGVMSFWVAFILAHNNSWQKKLIWSVGGIVFLWFLNCCRVALLIVSIVKRWNTERWMDSHALFNLIVYSFIIMMIFFYYKLSKRKEGSSRLAPDL